jgi:hypothetical protein
MRQRVRSSWNQIYLCLICPCSVSSSGIPFFLFFLAAIAWDPWPVSNIPLLSPLIYISGTSGSSGPMSVSNIRVPSPVFPGLN